MTSQDQEHHAAGDGNAGQASQTPVVDGIAGQSAGGGRLTLGEGIFIAVLTSLVYLFAFRYERGFLAAFGIPEEMVTVDTSILIAGILSIGLFVASGAALAYGITGLTSQSRRVIRYRNATIIVLMLATALIAGLLRNRIAYFGALPFVLVVVYLLVDVVPVGDIAPASHLSAPIWRTPLTRSMALMVCLYTYIYADTLGGVNARARAKDMLVIRQTATTTTRTSTAPAVTTGLLVVRQHDGKWLCAELQIESQQLLRKFRVIDPATLTTPAERVKLDNLRFPKAE